MHHLVESGADLIELGVPFSDPMADGPTIQEAAQRSLANGMSISKCLQMVRELRKDFDLPIIMFGYANPVFRYGYESFCADAAEAGVDGLLVVDMPFEQMAELRPYSDKNDLCLIPLIAPTTPPERMAMICRDARGFIYYIMVTGVTGARQSVATGVGEHVGQLRSCTDLPVAVGFGVSNGDQARSAAEDADAVVVGSALVRAAVDGRLAELVSEISSVLG